MIRDVEAALPPGVQRTKDRVDVGGAGCSGVVGLSVPETEPIQPPSDVAIIIGQRTNEEFGNTLSVEISPGTISIFRSFPWYR